MFSSIKLSTSQSALTLYPGRGGIITGIILDNVELLYQEMLEETLHDTSKSVRGGIPILFPNAGFLTPSEQICSGWNLPQHGFVRTHPWEIIKNKKTATTHEIIQEIRSEDICDTYGYPWSGNITNTILLKEDSVNISYSIANTGDNEIPIAFGLHPYFRIPGKDKSNIKWEWKGGEIINNTLEYWSSGGTTHLDIPSDGCIVWTIPGVGTIEMILSGAFKRLWIWSLPEKDFVCIEPTYGDDGTIYNNPYIIPAHTAHEISIQIRKKKTF